MLLGKGSGKNANIAAQVLVPFAASGIGVARLADKAARGKKITGKNIGNLVGNVALDLATGGLGAGAAKGAKAAVRGLRSTRHGDKLALRFSNEAYKTRPVKVFENYKLDKTFSNNRTLVYHNKFRKHTYVAHRGTVPTNKMDLANDARIVAGTFGASKRIKNASKTHRLVLGKYGDNVTHTGHSLGGTTADIVGGKFNSKVVTYNKGTTPSLRYKKTSNTMVHNTTGLDPISGLSVFQKGGRLHRPKKFNVHSLENFRD